MSPRLALLGALFVAQSAAAHAQAPARVVVVMADAAEGSEGGGVEAARSRLIEYARARGRVVVDARPASLTGARGVSGQRLEAIATVERELVRARGLAASLLESEALVVLSRARETIEQAIDTPGASRWAAEVEIGIAIVAHQAGLSALAEQALRAAATLDPSRILGSAEAPPALVARARAIAEETAVGPRGRFQVEVEAEGARVFFDDVLVGSAPASIEAPIGWHVLRVEASGYRPYARRIMLHEGSRPPLSLRLWPERDVAAARAAIDAARRLDLDAASEALRASGLDLELWVAIASPSGSRLLFSRCDAEGCRRARRLGRGAPISVADAGAFEVMNDPFDEGRGFLAERRASTDHRDSKRGRRIAIWTSVGVAIVGGTVAAVLAARPRQSGDLVTIIDFGELGVLAP